MTDADTLTCSACGEPLLDTEALEVTGTRTGLVFYVHKVGLHGGHCFQKRVGSQMTHTIRSVVPETTMRQRQRGR